MALVTIWISSLRSIRSAGADQPCVALTLILPFDIAIYAALPKAHKQHTVDIDGEGHTFPGASHIPSGVPVVIPARNNIQVSILIDVADRQVEISQPFGLAEIPPFPPVIVHLDVRP